MSSPRRSFRAVLVATALVTGSGCATIETLDTACQRAGNGPLIMSGTRFDLEATFDRERARRRHGIDGPLLPLADLPFSFTLDALVLPATVVMEMFDVW